MHRIPCSVEALNCGPFCVARRAKLILYMSVYHGQREGQVARFTNEFHLLMTCRAGHVSSFQSARSLILGETCEYMLIDKQERANPCWPEVTLVSIATLHEDSSRIARALFPLGPMMAEDICFVTTQRMMHCPASGPRKLASAFPETWAWVIQHQDNKMLKYTLKFSVEQCRTSDKVYIWKRTPSVSSGSSSPLSSYNFRLFPLTRATCSSPIKKW